jgi:hypothetical protein
VPEDDAEAKRWYLLAAGQNYGYAQFLLGELFDEPQSRQTAVRWYVKAALNGDRTRYRVTALVRLAALHAQDGPAVLSETDAAELARLRDKYPDLFIKQADASSRDPIPPNLPRVTPSLRDTAAAHMAELVDQIERELKPGKILFNPALSMKVGIKKRVAIRIAGAEFSGDLSKNLSDSNPIKEESVRVGRFMTVAISGPGFKVESDSPGLAAKGAQIVPRGDFAEWIFYVTPQESGKHRLSLSAAIRYKLPDREEIRNLPVMERDIDVDVNFPYVVETFVASELKWVVGGLLSVLAAGFAFLFKAWFEGQGLLKKHSKRALRSKVIRLAKSK